MPSEPESSPHFETALSDYLSSILDIAAAAQSGSLGSSGREHSIAQLTGLAKGIEELAHSGDLAGVAEKAVELRAFLESIEDARRTAFQRLQELGDEVQKKLREAGQLAAMDPLTGVANRREFDRQLAQRTAAGTGFCILLFDLDRFKAVNDRYGHLCGDRILKQAGVRLSVQVRARDLVCRWGGDEFVVILECGLTSAMIRSREIARRLAGPYRVPVEGREIAIDIAVSCGLAEHRPGESPEQLFERVDASMYREKNK